MSWKLAAWAALYVGTIVLGSIAARKDAAGLDDTTGSAADWPHEVLFVTGFLALGAATGFGWVAGGRRGGGIQALAAIAGGILGVVLYSGVLAAAY